MIEKIKELNQYDTITVDNQEVEDLAGSIDFKVKNIRVYSNDDYELVVVNLEEIYLLVHSIESVPQYYIYELQDSGSMEYLSENGYDYINDDNDFRKKIVINEDGKRKVFHYSDLGPIYGLNVDRSDETIQDPIEVSICEYASKNSYDSRIFIEIIDEITNIFTGFEIDESDLKL